MPPSSSTAKRSAAGAGATKAPWPTRRACLAIPCSRPTFCSLQVRKVVSNPVLEYTTVSGDDYLVEVKNKDVGRVPKDWIKISGTKSVARYRSPFIVAQVRRRDVHWGRMPWLWPSRSG